MIRVPWMVSSGGGGSETGNLRARRVLCGLIGHRPPHYEGWVWVRVPLACRRCGRTVEFRWERLVRPWRALE